MVVPETHQHPAQLLVAQAAGLLQHAAAGEGQESGGGVQLAGVVARHRLPVRLGDGVTITLNRSRRACVS